MSSKPSLPRPMTDSRGDQTDVAVGLASTLLAAQNPYRVALVIQAPPTNRVTLTFGHPAALDVGVTLYPGGNPLVLSRAFHGGLCTGPIFAISAVAGQSVSVWEALSDAP